MTSACGNRTFAPYTNPFRAPMQSVDTNQGVNLYGPRTSHRAGTSPGVFNSNPEPERALVKVRGSERLTLENSEHRLVRLVGDNGIDLSLYRHLC